MERISSVIFDSKEYAQLMCKCGQPAKVKGMCNSCYMREYKKNIRPKQDINKVETLPELISENKFINLFSEITPEILNKWKSLGVIEYIKIHEQVFFKLDSVIKLINDNTFIGNSKINVGDKINDARTKQLDTITFENVIKYIKDGDTVENACKKVNIGRIKFYKKISQSQKDHLSLTILTYKNKPKYRKY